MKKQKVKIFISLLAIIPLIIFSYQEADTSTRSNDISVIQEKEVAGTNEVKDESVVRASQEEQIILTHQKIIEKMKQFMDTLVQDIDTAYKVKHMNAKEELYQAFEYITTREIAKPYVEYYYQEEADGLYILPTETPPWFVEGKAYQKEAVADNIYHITQHNQSDLHGAYVIKIEMTYNQGEWKITKINHNHQKDVTIEAKQAV
ncbi:hypothetical protein [Paraliobacillus sp. JSM ZJ581]|uniref:hypothetical protein n=1 Tax=Paraliobacillus sp. JSM ZJ581 TaxID=3342118 RepID=UPI0035A955F4